MGKTDGDVSSTSTRSESSRDKAEDGRGRGRATADRGTTRRKRAPEVLRTATATAEQRFFADAYTQETLYPGLFLQGSPPEFVTYLTDENTGRPQHSYEFQTGPDYGNVDRVKWMGQGLHNPRQPEKKPEFRWSGVTRMVSNQGTLATLCYCRM